MSDYIRPKQRGATVFFTVTLAARGTDVLTREIETLRQAVRVTRMERPFGIDAWVVLPDHMHCVWTLPEGDADFSTRWSVIKARFPARCRMWRNGGAMRRDASMGYGRDGFGNTISAMKKITARISDIVG